MRKRGKGVKKSRCVCKSVITNKRGEGVWIRRINKGEDFFGKSNQDFLSILVHELLFLQSSPYQ